VYKKSILYFHYPTIVLFGSGLLESVNVMLAWDHIPRIGVCDYNKHLTSREKKRFPWLNKIDKKGRKKKTVEP